MVYLVYRVQYKLGLQDPDVPHTEYHTVLFVTPSPTSPSGTIFHVAGDITSCGGMYFETKLGKRPGDSPTFYSKQLIGVAEEKELGKWEAVLKAFRRPAQQKAYNIERKKTEPFKILDPLTFYEDGEERRKLEKCTEWVDEVAIPALREAGLLKGLSGLDTCSLEKVEERV